MGVGGQCHAPAALPSEKTGTHCKRGWMGPRAGLDGCGNISTLLGFDRQTVQSIASRCTDYTIPALDSVMSLF